MRPSVFTRRSRVSERIQSKQSVKGLHLRPGAEVVSFLPLQMSLYFNVCYSPLWFFTLLFALVIKYSELAAHYKYITIVIYIIMFVVEVCRLYLGYEGNLREKVGELAGFWLLSILQTLFTLYLLFNFDSIILPVEIGVNIIFIFFVGIQLIVGFKSLQLMVQAQAVKFHLSQFDKLDNIHLQPVSSDKTTSF